MRRAAFVAVVAAVAAGVPGAEGASPSLPPPAFTLPLSFGQIAAAGYRVAVVSIDECAIYTARLTARAKAKPVAVRKGLQCDEEWVPIDVWLGAKTIGALMLNSPSPHGEAYELRQGPLPTGPLKLLGEEFGWHDSGDTYAFGCEWGVVTGGGISAASGGPNTLNRKGHEDQEIVCPAGATTKILLGGASRASVTVDGSWDVIGTDGRRLVLSRIDRKGQRTGEIAYFGLDGKRLAAPRIDAATAKTAYRALLAPEGLVLLAVGKTVAPTWRAADMTGATMGYGRLFYVRGSSVHVRRIRDGRDRVLLALPRGNDNVAVAAGSFGLAIGAQTRGGTSVYRIGWRTIDGVLPAR